MESRIVNLKNDTVATFNNWYFPQGNVTYLLLYIGKNRTISNPIILSFKI